MAEYSGINIVTSGSYSAGDIARADNVAASGGGEASPVPKTKIASITIDVLNSESLTISSQVTQYPVESGTPITDNIRPESDRLEIVGKVTGSTVYTDDPGGKFSRLIGVVDEFRRLQSTREVTTIVTGLDTYSDMALERVELRREAPSEFLFITASFVKIRKVGMKTATFPNPAPKAVNKTAQTKTVNAGSPTQQEAPKPKPRMSGSLNNIMYGQPSTQ